MNQLSFLVYVTSKVRKIQNLSIFRPSSQWNLSNQRFSSLWANHSYLWASLSLSSPSSFISNSLHLLSLEQMLCSLRKPWLMGLKRELCHFYNYYHSCSETSKTISNLSILTHFKQIVQSADKWLHNNHTQTKLKVK